MSDHFEWNTEEDESVWEEQVEQFTETPEPKKRPYKALAIIAVLFIVAAGVVYWQVNQRVELATANVRADLLSTHNLINRAVALQDVNLLAPLLSGRDMTWTRHQETMMREDALFGRTAMGLPLAEPPTNLVDGDTRLTGLELSADLNSAELQFVEKYQLGDEVVDLQQTAVYRRGRERWLMAPPEDEFWGDWETFEVDGITFVFPERDAELGERLAEQLANNLYADCDLVDLLKCPDLRLLFVRFDTDVASLVATSDPVHLFDARMRLDLPAPTLVGHPVNDASFDALVQAYEAQIFTAVLAEAMDYDCCHHAPFVQAITDYYLAEIGLKQWPVSQETYNEIANQVLTIDRLFTNWSDANFLTPWDEERAYVYGFVDFMMNANPDKPPLQMLQQLNGPQGIQAGLAGLFDGRYGQGVLIQEAAVRDWWVYARANALDSQEERPLPLPEQALQLVCSRSAFEDNNPLSTLYRFDPQTTDWQEELAQSGLIFFNPLPSDAGIILQQIQFEANNWQATYWQDGEGEALVDSALPFALSLGQANPSGESIVLYSGNPDEGFLDSYLLNLSSCDGSACDTQALQNTPIWSPNGEKTLLTSSNIFDDTLFRIGDRISMFNPGNELISYPIMLGDALGQPLTGENELLELGMSPFWITDDMFGFITLNDNPPNPTQELVIGNTDDAVVRSLISTTNLLHAVPEAERPMRLTMRYVVANPTDPTMLAVMATSREDGYLFIVDRESGEVELRMTVGVESNHTFSFSPDGRFIVMSGNVQGDSNFMGIFYAILLHDIEANETEVVETGLNTFAPAFTFDWSKDGNWLMYVYGNDFLWLVAPEYDYQELIRHDFGGCTSAAWVD